MIRTHVCIVLLVCLTCGCVDNPNAVQPEIDAGQDTSEDVFNDASDGTDGSQVDMPDIEQLDIYDRLKALDSVVEVTEEEPLDGFRRFNVIFEQNINQDVRTSPTFLQRVRLYHKHENAPMVMTTGGYDLATFDRENARGTAGTWELTDYIDGANQVSVGNRFYAGAFPIGESQDWRQLTSYQTVADHHRIVDSLSEIYASDWIRNGYSKGGKETLIHEWLFPNDFVLSVAESAPLLFGVGDPRHPSHLAAVGTEECRTKLREITFSILRREDDFVAWYMTRFPGIDAFQARIILLLQTGGLAHNFWWGRQDGDCDRLPLPDDEPEKFAALLKAPGAEINEDDPNAENIAYAYYTLTERGTFESFVGNEADELFAEGLITGSELSLLNGLTPHTFGFEAPWSHEPEFDSAVNFELASWLRNDSTEIITTFAEWDPWAAERATIKDDPLNGTYTMSQGSHDTALEDLSDDELARFKAQVLSRLPARTQSFTQPVSIEKKRARREMRSHWRRTRIY